MLIHTQPPSASHLLQVYGPETTQRELFQGTVRDLVKEVLQGGNSLVFTYGVTNAGKTFTFLGLFHCHGWNFHSIMRMFVVVVLYLRNINIVCFANSPYVCYLQVRRQTPACCPALWTSSSAASANADSPAWASNRSAAGSL